MPCIVLLSLLPRYYLCLNSLEGLLLYGLTKKFVLSFLPEQTSWSTQYLAVHSTIGQLWFPNSLFFLISNKLPSWAFPSLILLMFSERKVKVMLCTEPVSPNQPRERTSPPWWCKGKRESFVSSALGLKPHATQRTQMRAPNKAVWRFI